jgi:hypothetical protein
MAWSGGCNRLGTSYVMAEAELAFENECFSVLCISYTIDKNIVPSVYLTSI